MFARYKFKIRAMFTIIAYILTQNRVYQTM